MTTAFLLLGSCFLLLLMGVIVINVIFRLLFSNISGSYEMAEYCVPIVACASILATIYGSHVLVELVTNKLRPKLKWATYKFAHLISLFWVGLVFGAGRTAIRNTRLGEFSEILHLPYAPMRWMWVTTSLFIAGYYLIQVIRQKSDNTEEKHT